ncbi:MAG: hypothetical protein WBN70_20240 [Polyangiales bacterium]
MSTPEEKLGGADQALADLGKSDEEISEMRSRFAGREPADLQAVDSELEALSEGVSVELASTNVHTAETRVPEAADADAGWDDEVTEVEILDESDFVLLVDEDDLEELEKVGEDDAMKTAPPSIPQEGEEDDDGFFKKLFSGRRSRPPQQ